MEETTCPLTEGKAIEICSENFEDDCVCILENLFIKCKIPAFNSFINIINTIDIAEKTKLAGKLANFSMDYALNEGITYKVENSNNYPIYNEVINEEFLKKVKQEPIPNLNQRIELFLKFLREEKNFILTPNSKIITENIILDYNINYNSLPRNYRDAMYKFYQFISYTETRDWDEFIKYLRSDKKFIKLESKFGGKCLYSVTIKGQEFLKKKSNNKKIKNNSIETVKNNSNIRPSTQERISVIEEDYQLNIKHRKINNLFGELKKIEVKNFPNASALLLRAFLELSINFYLSEKNLELRSNNISLIGKIQKIIEHIGLTPTEKEPLTAIIANPNNPAHTQILNSYTHNKDHHPDPISIKTAFDNLSILFKKIYSE